MRPRSEAMKTRLKAIRLAQVGWSMHLDHPPKTSGLSLLCILCKNGTSHPLHRSQLGFMQDQVLAKRGVSGT